MKKEYFFTIFSIVFLVSISSSQASSDDRDNWIMFFSTPNKLCSSLNSHGFNNTYYQSSKFPPPKFQCSGTLVAIGENANTYLENNMGLYVYGSTSDTVDEVYIKININQPKYETSASNEAVKILNDFFKKSKIQFPTELKEGIAKNKNLKIKNSDDSLLILKIIERQSGKKAKQISFIRPGITPQF